MIRTCGSQRNMVYITITQFMLQCIHEEFNVQKVKYFLKEKNWINLSSKQFIVIPVGDIANSHWSLIVFVRPWQFLEQATLFATESLTSNASDACYSDKTTSGTESRACCFYMDSYSGTHPNRAYIFGLKRYRNCFMLSTC